MTARPSLWLVAILFAAPLPAAVGRIAMLFTTRRQRGDGSAPSR